MIYKPLKNIFFCVNSVFQFGGFIMLCYAMLCCVVCGSSWNFLWQGAYVGGRQCSSCL